MVQESSTCTYVDSSVFASMPRRDTGHRLTDDVDHGVREDDEGEEV